MRVQEIIKLEDRCQRIEFRLGNLKGRDQFGNFGGDLIFRIFNLSDQF